MPGSHWTPSDIALELRDLEKLLEARPNLHDRRDALVMQMKLKIDAMEGLSANDFLELYGILEKSTLPQESLQRLLGAVDAHAEGNANVTRLQLRPQQCDALAAYLTEAELQKIATQSMWAGASVLATRLRLLGVRSLRESTKKMATAILLLHEWKRGGKMPVGDAAYVLSQQVLAAFQNSPVATPPGATALVTYPVDPLDLPAAHLKASYGEAKPARQSFPDLQWVSRVHTPVRASSKQVTSPPAPWRSSGRCAS